MNKLIVASVLLAALAGAVSAHLSAKQMQECVDKFTKLSAEIDVPAEIEAAAQFTRDLDPTGSLSMLDIITRHHIEFNDYMKKTNLDNLKKTAEDFLDVLLLKFPGQCMWDSSFMQQLKEKEKEGDGHPVQSEVLKLLDYMLLCQIIGKMQ